MIKEVLFLKHVKLPVWMATNFEITPTREGETSGDIPTLETELHTIQISFNFRT